MLAEITNHGLRSRLMRVDILKRILELDPHPREDEELEITLMCEILAGTF